MQQPVPTTDGTFRALRKVHLIMLLSVFPYVWLAERAVRHIHHSPDRGFALAIELLAATAIVAAIVLRTTLIQPALDVLRTKADDKVSLARWRSCSILSYIMAEVVVVFGFEMRILGATITQSAAFYISGIVLMLFLRPRRP
jgi:hypothetical protein